MPNPEYQGNKDDALTALLSIYGGNALNPMKGGAVGAGSLFDFNTDQQY